MEFSRSIAFRLILKTVTLVVLLFSVRNEAAPTANGDEYFNTTSREEDTTVHIRSSKDYPSGDSYLDEAYEECVIAKDPSRCVKYEALKYIHELTSVYAGSEGRANEERAEFQLWGPIKLIPLQRKDIPTDVPALFSDLDSRSKDSEPTRLFRFILREIGRFVGSYALAINIPTVSTSGRGTEDLDSPRFIDDDFFGGGFREGKNVCNGCLINNRTVRIHDCVPLSNVLCCRHYTEQRVYDRCISWSVEIFVGQHKND
jgi:hypothetical protein